jgi:lysophospholipase L1-like esterase
MIKKNISKIYCIGDSITNGARNEFFRDYVLELNYIFRDKNFIFLNNSVNGETTSEILKRAIKVMANEDLEGIIFLGGTNDSKVPIPPKIFKKNLLTLISICKKKNIKLTLITVPKMYTGLPNYSKSQGNDFIKKYNKILKDISNDNKLTMVDLGKLKESEFADGIHSNNQGCEKIAKTVSQILKKTYASLR